MNIDQKINKSHDEDSINFSLIKSLNKSEKLVLLSDTPTLTLDPIWKHAKVDLEGKLYAQYIKRNSAYSGIYVRQEVAALLDKASKMLPDGLALVVHAGHRPLAVQKMLLAMLVHDYLLKHPTKTKEEALMHARTYVSDPVIETPPHCCGAAVDVEIMSLSTHKMLDFGSPVNYDDNKSCLHNTSINKESQANRKLLLTTMLAAGFASLYSEWWHYSYGDQKWAWFYGHKKALYGITEPQL